jgi:hypothetical protein
VANWNILGNVPNAGQAFTAGLEHGQSVKRENDTRNALAAFAHDPSNPAGVNALLGVNPALGFKAADYQRETLKRDAMGHLFDPANPPRSALVPDAAANGPPPPVAMNPDGSAPTEAVSSAPQTVVDPAHLPARTDGLTLNPDALRQLYQIDPESALQMQRHVYDANQAQFKTMQQRGAQFASFAWHLKQLPAEQRAGELEAMAPQLIQFGVTPEQLAEADLSDAGLDRYIATGRAIGDILRDDRAERRFEHDVSDDEADNERADRNTDSMISHRGAQEGIARRGQNIASGDRRRGQDVADTRARRGQDLTDKRVRESAGFRGRGGKGGAVPTATNPQTGHKMEYRGGKWVDAQ